MADNEVGGRIKSRVITLARQVVEHCAAEAHRWLKKLAVHR